MTTIYTYPEPEGPSRYDFNDVAIGVEATRLILTPTEASASITRLQDDGRPMVSQNFPVDLHIENTNNIMGPNVWTVPASGLLITFPLPVKRVNIYLASNTFDNERRPFYRIYGLVNGNPNEWLGGDRAGHPIGPFGELAPPLPDGYDTKTTDMQYMVWHMPEPLPPPYGNPIHGVPATHVHLFPDGDDVVMGRIQAVTTEHKP